jgi:hypothetical protein
MMQVDIWREMHRSMFRGTKITWPGGYIRTLAYGFGAFLVIELTLAYLYVSAYR